MPRAVEPNVDVSTPHVVEESTNLMVAKSSRASRERRDELLTGVGVAARRGAESPCRASLEKSSRLSLPGKIVEVGPGIPQQWVQRSAKEHLVDDLMPWK